MIRKRAVGPLVFSNEIPSAYVQCSMAQGTPMSEAGPLWIEGDGGGVILADLEWVLAQTPRDAERIYQTAFELNGEGHTGLIQIPDKGPAVLVAVCAGYGDGEFPCYWGINGKGEAINLTIDFLVYGRFDENDCWQHAFRRV